MYLLELGSMANQSIKAEFNTSYLFKALQISITTSTDRAIVFG
jgi:hypothetical protein